MLYGRRKSTPSDFRVLTDTHTRKLPADHFGMQLDLDNNTTSCHLQRDKLHTRLLMAAATAWCLVLLAVGLPEWLSLT